MKSNVWSVIGIVGFIFLLAGLAFKFLNLTLSYPFIREDLFSFSLGFTGFFMVVLFIIQHVEKKNQIKKSTFDKIEKKSNEINQVAKSRSFNFMIIFFPIILISLTTLGYLNLVAFFTLDIAYLIWFGYFIFQIKYLKSERI